MNMSSEMFAEHIPLYGQHDTPGGDDDDDDDSHGSRSKLPKRSSEVVLEKLLKVIRTGIVTSSLMNVLATLLSVLVTILSLSLSLCVCVCL